MNSISTIESNFIVPNSSTCTGPLLSMLFRLKYSQRVELNNVSYSSHYIPDKQILNAEINAAEVCLKEALKKFKP